MLAEYSGVLGKWRGAVKNRVSPDSRSYSDLLRYSNVEDLKIGTVLASTREHPLVFGGVTAIIVEPLKRRLRRGLGVTTRGS